mgnify:CR=1 FL=1
MSNYMSYNIISGDKPGKDSYYVDYHLGNMGGMTHLEILVKATNGSAGNASNGILNAIKEIEVKSEDNRTLSRLSGTQAYRLATLRDKEAPEISESADANAVQLVRIPILFGRSRDDEYYGLDLTKEPRTHLRVTYDLTAVRACGNDGYVSGSFDISVDASMTMNLKQPKYVGTFGASLVNAAWATRVGSKRLKVHTRERCVGLYLYSYLSGTADGALTSNVKLMAPTERDTIVNRGFTDLQDARKPYPGTKVTSWAPVWVDPNRLSEKEVKPLPGAEAYLELTELVANGSSAIIAEFIENQGGLRN